VFLDIRTGADYYRLVIATQHRAEPDADIDAEHDVADDARTLGNPYKAVRHLRIMTIEPENRHDIPLACLI
jgi:hypothetical protein